MSSVVEEEPPKAAAADLKQGDVLLQPSPRLDVLSFAVRIPASSTMEPPIAFDDDYESDDDTNGAMNAREMAHDYDSSDDTILQIPKRKNKKNKPIRPPPVANENAMEGGMGLVGTIIVLKTSYIVWFGWGQPQQHTGQGQARPGVNNSRLWGNDQGAHRCRMGQFLIAMPPKQFPGGAFAQKESSTSKLIGSEDNNNEGGDDMIARQMASRLSQKSGKPVLVSCSLDTSQLQSMGLDPDLLQARATALVEQRIWKLLKEYHETK